MMKRVAIITIFFTGFTLFVNAQKPLNRQLYEAVSSKDTLQVEALLSKNADANYKEKVMTFEMSMLILAVQTGSLKNVKLLIEHKAEVDWKDMFKSTALMYAAHSGNLLIIDHLIKNGANVHAKDEQGNTVLSAAKEGKHPAAVQVIETALKQN